MGENINLTNKAAVDYTARASMNRGKFDDFVTPSSSIDSSNAKALLDMMRKER
jgi:hypothetical protein